MKKSVFANNDWFEELEYQENKIVAVPDSIEADTFEIDLDRFDPETFSIGVDY